MLMYPIIISPYGFVKYNIPFCKGGLGGILTPSPLRERVRVRVNPPLP